MPDVLVVDDDRNLADALRARLSHAGFQVVVAHNGSEGVQLFHRFRPRVVLLDASMPDMSGFEVCQHIRAGDPENQTKVIFLSGANNPGEEYVRRCADISGGDCFIAKPYDCHEVIKLVSTMCRARDEVKV